MKAFKKYGVYVSILFGLLAVVMLFLSPAVKLVTLTSTVKWNITGFQAIFGSEKGFVQTEFNALGFFALVILVAGLVASLVPTIPPKLRYALGALLLVVSGIFFFLFPGTIGNNVKAATPIILSGVFVLVGAAINLALSLVELLKK